MRQRVLRRPPSKLKRVAIDALPVALMFDNFNAANETTLTGRTPPVRAVANTWAVPQGVYTINGNVVEARFPTVGQSVATFDMGLADVEMQVTVTFPLNGTGRVGGFTFRYVSNSDRWSTTANADLGVYRIIETTAGVSTTRAESNFAFQPNVPYRLRLTLQGDVITTTIDGVGSITYTSAVGNTRPRHGLRANNTIGSDPIKFEDFIILPAPSLSDVTATIAGVSFATSVTRMSMTIVDNNLIFSGATSQKATALANLANKFHHLNLFIESFGNGDTLGSWDGVSDAVSALPQPDLSSFINHWSTLDSNLNPDTWGIFGHRLPWQFTGSTTDAGVTTKSTSADYNVESRRLLTNKTAQYIEWVARWSSALMAAPYNIYRFYLGSEAKGFQTVVQVVVNGATIRADRNQSWDWDDYAGTPGRADMGQFAYFLAYREGLQLGAQRAGVAWSNIRIVSPYPVISHQGEIAASGNADAVKVDSRNDWLGSPVDLSDINGNGAYPGWPNIAGAVLTAEHVRLLQANSIGVDEWEYGIDYATFNEDKTPTPNISDHDLAYRRVNGMSAFSDKLLAKYGFTPAQVVKRQPEYYAKAQWPMDVAGEHFIEDALRDDYQASIRAVWLIACYINGIHYPDTWSPFGRGDQSTPVGGSDPNQWYGGMLVRTVTNSNNHAGSAVTGGGAAQAALAVIDGFKTHFPPGTALYAMTFSSPFWRGFASATKAAVVNQSGQTQTLSIGGSAPISFAPYQFRVVDR